MQNYNTTGLILFYFMSHRFMHHRKIQQGNDGVKWKSWKVRSCCGDKNQHNCIVNFDQVCRSLHIIKISFQFGATTKKYRCSASGEHRASLVLALWGERRTVAQTCGICVACAISPLRVHLDCFDNLPYKKYHLTIFSNYLFAPLPSPTYEEFTLRINKSDGLKAARGPAVV